MIYKGRVSAILDGGDLVAAVPYAGGVVTVPLVVPLNLKGLLPIGTPIIYILFEDNTGLVMSRMDGIMNSAGGAGHLTVTSDGDAIVINTGSLA